MEESVGDGGEMTSFEAGGTAEGEEFGEGDVEAITVATFP